MRQGSLVALSMALLSAGGCGSTVTATARIETPAQVPVRSFPRIWVAAGHLPEEISLASKVAAHLSEGGHVRVRRVDVEDLEPARKAGRVPQATAVLLLDLRFEQHTRSEWTTRPETVCGPYGCYTDERSYLYDVPVLSGTLTLTVYDGPTARVLQRTTVQVADEGRPYDVMRQRLIAELARKVAGLVDQGLEAVRVTLLRVDAPGVDAALDAARAGHWHDARVALEAAVKSHAARALPAEARARLYYDLGQARRFDPTTLDDPDRHFTLAEQALRRARDLHAIPLIDEAIRDLARHRAQVRLVLEQRAAARRNARAAEGDGRASGDEGIPAPPPSYEDIVQPPATP